jgi:hypothetical protein
MIDRRYRDVMPSARQGNRTDIASVSREERRRIVTIVAAPGRRVESLSRFRPGAPSNAGGQKACRGTEHEGPAINRHRLH